MKLKVIDDLPFDDKSKVLDLIAGVDELSLRDKENIFSIRGNYFKGNTDKNIIDIYKEELEIFLWNDLETLLNWKTLLSLIFTSRSIFI